ncbi:MAG: hypothetical protein QNJ22_09495 [Desulfosarcinaceae bacterium]|nr:hypothetical protein [Desulfosarcinaceae bacterium]
MKRMLCVLPMLLFLIACSAGSKGSDEGRIRTLQLNEQVAGEIASEGDVDWYAYEMTAPNTLLQVSCNSSTLRPDVDLLLSVYEEDADGNKVRLFATHAPEEAELPADLQINLFIDVPKTIFIAVRDLQDNEASADETYYVKVSVAEANDGNDTLTQANHLRIDDETTCQDDAIDTVGDTDCYTFDVSQEGVYLAKVDFNRFNGGTAVNLAVELYDDAGNQLARLTEGQGEQYYLQHHLDVGTYFLLVEDQGQDDADAASIFSVCVESLSSQEFGDNDTRDTAQLVTATAPDTYTVSGTLDYEGDADWYRLPIGATGASGLKILQLAFDDGSDPIVFTYQVGVEDDADPATALLSHDVTAGSDTYLTQIKAGTGDHYLRIQPSSGQHVNQSAAYTATITVVDVDDPAETAGDGNDSASTADAIADGGDTVSGKISYRGDDDWYRINVDLSTPKVLSVDLSTTPGADDPHVEYYLSVMRDEVNKKTYDANGEDGATHLKTSLLVPQDAGTATYLIKVSDFQGNEGDTFDYTLVVAVNEIPDAGEVPAGPAAADYFDEKAESGAVAAVEVELENTALDQPHFQADTALFDFSRATQTTVDVDGHPVTTIEFPWVAGFIDYEGDQDWFRLQLDKLNVDDDNWYYDVDVQVVASGDSEVEYVWKLYRDSNGNGLLVDRPTASDGYVGAIGDTDPVDTSAFSIDTDGLAEDLWIGDGWGAGDYYISLSDFNYVRIDNGDGSSSANPEPDADWSHSAAYYYKVTLKYHPGFSQP